VNCYRIHQKSLNFIYPFKFYKQKCLSWLYFSWATQYVGCRAYSRNECRWMVIARSNCSRIRVVWQSNHNCNHHLSLPVCERLHRVLNKQALREAATMPLPPASWPMTLKVVSEGPSHVWRGLPCANFSLPRPLFCDLGPMYTTDRRQARIIALCPLP